MTWTVNPPSTDPFNVTRATLESPNGTQTSGSFSFDLQPDANQAIVTVILPAGTVTDQHFNVNPQASNLLQIAHGTGCIVSLNLPLMASILTARACADETEVGVAILNAPAKSNSATKNFTVAFGEPVNGVDLSDFSYTANPSETITLDLVAVSSTEYFVTVSLSRECADQSDCHCGCRRSPATMWQRNSKSACLSLQALPLTSSAHV